MVSQWHDLPAPPALPNLFLRAALRRGVKGKTLPEFGLRSSVTVDPKHLANYRKVCGFADDGLLPPTYPHILAFPLQMKLLTDARFPFPLLGLVHLENRIRVLRPLGGLGPFTVSVYVENLRPHDKGAVFSLITRLEDQLGLVWEGDSQMLCRSVRIEGKPQERDELPSLELSQVARWKAPKDIGRRYAKVAGDFNPIHLFGATAKLFGFPTAIAHGLWNKAHALALLGERLPQSGYEVDVRFQKPVLLPSEVTLVASAPADQGQISLRGKNDLPHMTGTWKKVA